MEKMWCMLIHFGTNLWYEEGNNRGGGEKVWKSPASDTLRFDRDVFYRYLGELRAAGVNTIVLDVAESEPLLGRMSICSLSSLDWISYCV